MERRLKCGVCAAAALALVLCFSMEQKTRAMQTAGNAQTTLVIDAGHGGFDGGAVGADGTAEQDINLSIAKRVQVLANFFGVPTAMTRPDENALDYNPSRTVRENKIADIKAREKLVNSIPSPVFLSIHLNKFSDAQYHGAQVFYSTGNVQGKPLAEQIQQCLIDGCDPLNPAGQCQGDQAVRQGAVSLLFQRKSHGHGGMRLSVQSGRRSAAAGRSLSQTTCCRRDLRIFTQPERYVTEEI